MKKPHINGSWIDLRSLPTAVIAAVIGGVICWVLLEGLRYLVG